MSSRLSRKVFPPSLLQDIRLIFATILTDPGSSLAYGADAVIAVTAVLISQNYELGLATTLGAGLLIMCVYLVAILAYNNMTKNHVHPVLGGGAFVSSLLTSRRIQNPRLKKIVENMGKLGTASLLSDFPATQAISLVAGVEALYFIPMEQRFKWALIFLIFISLIQRYGLGNLARYMIWPVVSFYVCNLLIQFAGLYEILAEGWERPILEQGQASKKLTFWPIILGALANGSTLITGVEVGYSSVNFPHHKGRAIRISMWMLYAIVLCTYTLQLINFLGLGIDQRLYESGNIAPVPIQIARHLGGDGLATAFGLLTALMLLLAAQTAQSDFPLEILRASRGNFFPKAIGDAAWRRIKSPLGLGGHEGVYNPRATLLLAFLSLTIVYFFPHSHDIESMYGLAVVTAMCVDIGSYFLRQIRIRIISLVTLLGLIVMTLMLGNILYNKFFEGAWFIVLLMFAYLFLFLFSDAVYSLWEKKLNTVPISFALWYPAFAGLPINKENVVLVSKFHPGVFHYLKNFIKSGSMPQVVHFQSDPKEELPPELPPWFKNVSVGLKTDMISAIVRYIRRSSVKRVHLIPLLISGMDSIERYYFGNSMERLKRAVSQYVDVQVEYNKERINMSRRELLEHIFPIFKRWRAGKKNPPKNS